MDPSAARSTGWEHATIHGSPTGTHLLKGQLREVFAPRGTESIALLEARLARGLRRGRPDFAEARCPAIETAPSRR